MTPEKEQAFTEKGRINSLASCGAYVAADRLFDASLDACRHYCLEGTVHTTGLAGGFDFCLHLYVGHMARSLTA